MKTKIDLNCLLLICFWSYFANGDDNQEVERANNYVDEALQLLRNDTEIAKHLNELSIPDYVRNDFAVRNLKVLGLLSLYRNNDCSLSHDNNVLNIVANVAVKDVFVTMDYTAKVMFFSIHGQSIISVDHLSTRLDFSDNDGQVTLNSFKVTNLGDYKVTKMTGMSFMFNWLLKLMANVAAQSAKQSIIVALENEAGKAIADLMKKQKLPIV